jgi:hypothetical protein
MVKVLCDPASPALEVLASEGASRLASIDPRLGKVRVTIEGGRAGAGDGCIFASLELLLPEHQIILSRCDARDSAAAVRDAFDAAADSLREIARRDALH